MTGVAFCADHGDLVTDEFRNQVLPHLPQLTSDEKWKLAGMLVFLNSVAEAREVAERAVE